MTYAQNKKAFHDYFIEEKIEAGLSLKGTEVKSIRAGKMQLLDSYILFKDNEAYLHNAHIAPFDFGNRFNHEPTRTRKVLLHKDEVLRLSLLMQKENVNIIPLSVYGKKRWIKVELGIAKPKKKHDKRQSIKEKESKREIDRFMKNRG